jgi:hypothetical protein
MLDPDPQPCIKLYSTCSPPLSDGLAVEDEDLEEGVHEEDPVRLNGGGIQQHRLRGTLHNKKYLRLWKSDFVEVLERPPQDASTKQFERK